MTGRTKEEQEQLDKLLPPPPEDPKLDPYYFDRGRRGRYPLVVTDDPDPKYQDTIAAREDRAQAIALLEEVLSRTRRGYRLHPKVLKALQVDEQRRLNALAEIASYSSINRLAAEGYPITDGSEDSAYANAPGQRKKYGDKKSLVTIERDYKRTAAKLRQKRADKKRNNEEKLTNNRHEPDV